MSRTEEHDAWNAGQSYDHYMGRWSRLVARDFLAWLGAPENADWVDIGCGTGALTQAILDDWKPKSVRGIESSEGFAAHAREQVRDTRASFSIAGAESLPLGDNSVDVAVSGLVLNFVPDKAKALQEMQRVVRPGGRVSFYVWDYPGGGLGFIDAFWKAATKVDPAAKDLDEARRFPFCTSDGLIKICRESGLVAAEIEPIEVTTTFADFDALWHPFSLGAGPAPGYCASLPEDKRSALRAELAGTFAGETPIRLPARAWAVRAASV